MKKFLLGLLLAFIIAIPITYFGIKSEPTEITYGGSSTPVTGTNPLPEDNYDTFITSPFSSSATEVFVNSLPNVSSSIFTIYASDGTTPREKILCTGWSASPNKLTGCLRGLNTYPINNKVEVVTSTGLSHSRNSRIAITDNIHFTGRAIAILNGNQNTGNEKFVIGAGNNNDIYLEFDVGSSTANPWVHYDSTNNQLKFRRFGESVETEIPLSLRGTYSNYASLPTTASNGDIAITTDDYKLYVYDATTPTWVLAGGSSGAGTVYKTEKLGSESDGGDLKTFSLTSGSWPDEKFLLVYKNGQLQRIGATNDYTEVDSDTIEFTYTLASDDLITMIVVSIDLYNPAWTNVTEDIIPDADNTHSLGSILKTWKNFFTKTASSWNWATTTPTTGYMPIAGTGGKLDNDWLNVTTTPTASLIPFGNASGQISTDWLNYTVTSTGVYTTSSQNSINTNYDVAVNCGFTPKLISVKYDLRGYSNTVSAATFSFGEAIWSDDVTTTPKSNTFSIQDDRANEGWGYSGINTSNPTVGVAGSNSSLVAVVSLQSIVNQTATVRISQVGGSTAGTGYTQSIVITCFK